MVGFVVTCVMFWSFGSLTGLFTFAMCCLSGVCLLNVLYSAFDCFVGLLCGLLSFGLLCFLVRFVGLFALGFGFVLLVLARFIGFGLYGV